MDEKALSSPRPRDIGSGLRTSDDPFNSQLSSLISQLPVASQTELIKSYAGDLLQLKAKIEEIRATNAESSEHLAALVELLNQVQQDGNKAHVTHTSTNSGGQTKIELQTRGTPIVRPLGGGCVVFVAAILGSGFLFMLLVLP